MWADVKLWCPESQTQQCVLHAETELCDKLACFDITTYFGRIKDDNAQGQTNTFSVLYNS